MTLVKVEVLLEIKIDGLQMEGFRGKLQMEKLANK